MLGFQDLTALVWEKRSKRRAQQIVFSVSLDEGFDRIPVIETNFFHFFRGKFTLSERVRKSSWPGGMIRIRSALQMIFKTSATRSL